MLNAGHARLDRDWNWSDIGSPFTRIYCVTEGRAWIIINGHRRELTPGHLYIIPAFTRHSYECDGRFSHYYLHIYESYHSGRTICDRYEQLPFEIVPAAGDREIFEYICRRHPELALTAYNPQIYDTKSRLADSARRFDALAEAEKMYIRGAVLILLSRFIEHATLKAAAVDRRLEPVLKYIDSHIDSAISLDRLAAEAAVSKQYLIRLFRHSFGTTPVAYMNRRRIEKAQLLLLTTVLPVKEIAYSLGFSDSSYFDRLFKKRTGCTPQKYREERN